MHKEVQVAPGVYVTDFRKNQTLIGVSEKTNAPQHPLIILDEVCQMDKQIQMLLLTINQIKEENNWEDDMDFKSAIEENWSVIVKVSNKMKENVLALFQMQYQPQNEKIEKVLNIDRIQSRLAAAEQECITISNKNNGVFV